MPYRNRLAGRKPGTSAQAEVGRGGGSRGEEAGGSPNTSAGRSQVSAVVQGFQVSGGGGSDCATELSQVPPQPWQRSTFTPRTQAAPDPAFRPADAAGAFGVVA